MLEEKSAVSVLKEQKERQELSLPLFAALLFLPSMPVFCGRRIRTGTKITCDSGSSRGSVASSIGFTSFRCGFYPNQPLLVRPLNDLAAGIDAILELLLKPERSRVCRCLRFITSAVSTDSTRSLLIVFHIYPLLSRVP
jgi:hypothetical protein